MKASDFKILSGSAIKVLAIICMTVDHVGFILLEGSQWAVEPLFMLGNTGISWLFLMRAVVGRMAFPLFAFLAVEGYIHTRSFPRYATTLFLFAVLSIIPFNMVHGSAFSFSRSNILFTLLLGIVAVRSMDKLRGMPSVLCVGATLALAWMLRVDYGMVGVALIALLYLLRERVLYQGLSLVAVFFGKKFTMAAPLAIIPIAMYNGKRGFIRGPWAKYVFYAYYPLHLLVLCLLRPLVL